MISSPKIEPALERIGAYVSPPGGAIAPFRIPANRLLFEMVTEGVVYAPDGQTLHGTGEIFVHHPGEETVSRTKGDAHYGCMTAVFRIDHLRNEVAWPRHFLWDDVRGVARFAEEMLYAFHHTELNHAVIGELIWSQFRFRLAQFLKQSNQLGLPPRIAGVMAYIERHHAEAIGIDNLALQAGLSASHLHAQFREHVGITPHQLLIHQRMRTARHLLATTREPIKAVATGIGYENTENFCRAFKKQFGITAASYRKKHKAYS